MTPEARLLGRALGVCRRHDPDPKLINLLERLCRAATQLVFAPTGRDAGRRALFSVGDPQSPITFAAKSDGIRALCMLARGEAVAVALIAPDARNGAEAARLLLKRALNELERYSAALAVELATFTIEGGVVRYCRRLDSPRIVGQALVLEESAQSGHIQPSLSKEIRS